MIKALSLINFQSHKETKVKFSEGLNCIVGVSDSGKSALLRGLYLIIENRPSGNGWVSHWAKDKEGKQTDDCMVTVETDSHIITRVKGTSKNTYTIFNSKTNKPLELEAVGKEVPGEVLSALNMTEVNIQKQFDPSFLLSQSAGEVARFFNKIIKLEDIDKVLSAADSMKREAKSNLDRYQIEFKKQTQQIEDLKWVEPAKGLADKLIRMEERRKGMESEIEKETSLLLSMNNIEKELKNIPQVSRAEKIIKEMIQINKQKGEVSRRLEGKELLLSSIKETNLEMKEGKVGKETIPLINSLKGIITKYQGTVLPATQMVKIIKEIREGQKEILAYNTSLKELQKEMPKVCPICGALLKGEGK